MIELMIVILIVWFILGTWYVLARGFKPHARHGFGDPWYVWVAGAPLLFVATIIGGFLQLKMYLNDRKGTKS